MSLKAKLEAVIYAAEEPVTLAQLTALFADEAFAWREEKAAAASDESRQRAEDSADFVRELMADAPAAVELVDSARYAGGERGEELMGHLLVPDAVSEAGCEAVAASATAVGNERGQATAVDKEGPGNELPAKELTAEEAALEARRVERRREREAREILRGVLEELVQDYAASGRGIEIREIAGGYRMATKPELHDTVRAFIKGQKPPLKLSMPALETLAVIAYKQPVTAPEVGEIRGVDSAGVLGSLMSRKLIATAGRKQVIGRPMLYKTTKEFLLQFGLRDLHELPSMEEFEKLAALALSEEPIEVAADAAAGAANLEARELGDESGPVAQSGDLFEADSGDGEPGAGEDLIASAQVGSAEGVVAGGTADGEQLHSDQDFSESDSEPREDVREHEDVPTSFARPPAEAQAPVERQDAEEVEAKR